MKSVPSNIVFFSSCLEKWGGSEELWAQSAELLAEAGYQIHVYKLNIDFAHPRIKRLLELGCRVNDLSEYLPSLPRRVWNRLLPFNEFRTLPFYINMTLAKSLSRLRPKLFVVSQGANFDGLTFLKECQLDKYPYVLISQKANELFWADDWDREWMKKIWHGAEKSFFVAEHNLKLTEQQFGIKLENAEVVCNPYLTKTEEPLPWTFSASDKIKLACVARLFPQEKGQDILLRVLASEKWRKRDVEISFFGKGMNESGLKDFARYLELDNVKFRGHVSDIDSIWREHQALVLPSRAEGLPLVIVEAMLCGRFAVATRAGGNGEVIENDITGFLAKSADEEGFDDALERAWSRRAEWEQIGKSAAGKIRRLVPPDPAREFAEKLMTLIR